MRGLVGGTMGRGARRRKAGVLAALALTVSVAACGQADLATEAGSGGSTDVIAFLMPDQASTRYERYDYPLFKDKVDDLCIRCEVVYSNAEGDAQKQREQADTALQRGAMVL